MVPGSLHNQRPLGYCHVQSNAGSEAFCVRHYALMAARRSVELQETKEQGKEAEGKGKEKVQEGEKAKGEEAGRDEEGPWNSILRYKAQKSRQLECILIKETDFVHSASHLMLILWPAWSLPS